jgi:hypothetical protein
MMREHRARLSVIVWWSAFALLSFWLSAASAHQDSCHRLHSCPSDHHTYVCGDKGRCD